MARLQCNYLINNQGFKISYYCVSFNGNTQPLYFVTTVILVNCLCILATYLLGNYENGNNNEQKNVFRRGNVLSLTK